MHSHANSWECEGREFCRPAGANVSPGYGKWARIMSEWIARTRGHGYLWTASARMALSCALVRLFALSRAFEAAQRPRGKGLVGGICV